MRWVVAAAALTLMFGQRTAAEVIKIEKLEIKSAVVEIPKSPDGEAAVVVIRVEIKNISKEALKLSSSSFKCQRHRLGCRTCGETTCAPLPPGVPSGQAGPRQQFQRL